MIKKIPNTPCINKLSIINIYEADYNLLQKFFWPKLSTKHAEATHILGENAQWCRPGCSADNVTLIEEFVNEIHRLRTVLRYLSNCFGTRLVVPEYCIDNI